MIGGIRARSVEKNSGVSPKAKSARIPDVELR
jgi:hypothetical protein